MSSPTSAGTQDARVSTLVKGAPKRHASTHFHLERKPHGATQDEHITTSSLEGDVTEGPQQCLKVKISTPLKYFHFRKELENHRQGLGFLAARCPTTGS